MRVLQRVDDTLLLIHVLYLTHPAKWQLYTFQPLLEEQNTIVGQH
jgi:hypothetical protein